MDKLKELINELNLLHAYVHSEQPILGWRKPYSVTYKAHKIAWFDANIYGKVDFLYKGTMKFAKEKDPVLFSIITKIAAFSVIPLEDRESLFYRVRVNKKVFDFSNPPFKTGRFDIDLQDQIIDGNYLNKQKISDLFIFSTKEDSTGYQTIFSNKEIEELINDDSNFTLEPCDESEKAVLNND
jgi:hypothetical protein